MPTYCYQTRNGVTFDRVFPIGQAPRVIRSKGHVAHRSFQAEHAGSRDVTAANWPMECVASGVHVLQSDELREHFRKSGVPTEVSRDGNPIYRNAQHRRRALKSRGMVDRSSYL